MTTTTKLDVCIHTEWSPSPGTTIFWVPGYCASRKENQSSDQFPTSKAAKATLFLSHKDTQDTQVSYLFTEYFDLGW